jgi:hypothetical protein
MHSLHDVAPRWFDGSWPALSGRHFEPLAGGAIDMHHQRFA